MRQSLKTILFLLLLSFQNIATAEGIWRAYNAGINDIEMLSISVFSGNDNFLCTASANSVYYSQDKGNSWREIFSLKGKQEQINFVTFDCSSPEAIYVATTQGLFITNNQGKSWQRIFRKIDKAKKNVNWVALDYFDCRKIYIGTDAGLFFSLDKGLTWNQTNSGLAYCAITSVIVHPINPQVLYLSNTSGLFKSVDSGSSWERIYLTSHKIANEEEEIAPESLTKEENQNLINCIAIDQRLPQKVFIATGEGVFLSTDAGENWHRLPEYGLGNNFVNYIVISLRNGEYTVFAATKNGVFTFLSASGSWRQLYQGMTSQDVRSLALSNNGQYLWAATDQGVFSTIDSPAVAKEFKGKVDYEQLLKEISENEPTVRQVQEAALRYADVIHPDRIRALRRNSKLKALLPQVNIDYDKTINYDSGSDVYYIGPRDWGLSLSWDVADLVFNEQERLIDSNARLQVQLRDDILDEVTRIYYERLKLQAELIMHPPKTPEEALNKQLRLKELTANIDALTGGYFSCSIEINAK
jgi:photosystem II stability/assembly factor-like uncharacterized protein